MTGGFYGQDNQFSKYACIKSSSMVPTVFTHVRSLNTLEQNHKVTNCTSMTRVTLKAKITSIKTFFCWYAGEG